jgi:hypothetical protein
MSPVVTTVDDVLDVAELERAWHGPADTARKETSKINQAQLTVTRNTASDFQDRQVYLYVDGELWGKVKYGRPVVVEKPLALRLDDADRMIEACDRHGAKLFVVHQFTPDMIRNKERIARRLGLAMTMNVDGFGNQANKIGKYDQFTSELTRFHDGFKLFYEEDTDLMSPAQVLARASRLVRWRAGVACRGCRRSGRLLRVRGR